MGRGYQKKLSLETCLDVIGNSSKLSVIPDIVIDNNDFHKANFQMSDGILSITCDKQKNEIIVKHIKFIVKLNL